MTTAEPMSEARLAEIRARDALFTEGNVNGWLIDEIVNDRRDLLREVDRLNAESAEMRRAMDGLEHALSERGAVLASLEQRLAECERERERMRRSLPIELFEGYRVYTALSPQASARTSPENVSDVQDAIAKLMRERIAALTADGEKGV